MNKTAIKNYAVAARKKWIQAIAQQAAFYGCTENSLPSNDEIKKRLADKGVFLTVSEENARTRLVDDIRTKGYQNTIEEIAYTWFNRLIAIRFMEVNKYLPSGIRVLSSEDSERIEPDCVREYARLDFLNQETAANCAADSDEKLYRYILIEQCNALGKIMPKMFTHIADYAAMLLPERLYIKDGLVHDLTHAITEEDFGEQVEIIGWLYQYYISEKKDEVFAALKKNVKITRENIPAATQLFTPDWIVKYMVENSLGRLWLEHCPPSMAHGNAEDALRELWAYYIDEADQEPEVEQKLKELRNSYTLEDPTQIKIIDPCMGSGHILVYAFDLLYQIYVGQGYSERDIPDLILENNIYGLDIDERACQLAYFSLMMKARGYNRRFFRREDVPQPQVYAIRDSEWIGGAYQHEMGDFLLSKEHQDTLNYLLDAFREAGEYGSILKLEDRDYKGLATAWKYTASQTVENFNITLWYSMVEKEIPLLIEQAILLTQKYDVVVTNPPFIGNKGMGGKLSEYLLKEFADYKADTFSTFIIRCGELAKATGYVGMFSPYVWMFIQSYEKLRNNLYSTKSITTLIQFEYSAFEEATVPVCSFVYRNEKTGEKGGYFRLVDFRGGMEVQRQKYLEAIANPKCGFFYTATSDNFAKIPGSPVAYWVSENALAAFDKYAKLGTIQEVRGGLTTGDNNRFLRFWFEVIMSDISFATQSIEETKHLTFTWYPIAKGGEYRKWYGNLEYIVNWKDDGADIKYWVTHNPKDPNTTHWSRRLFNIDCYFKKIITWSGISSGEPSMRIADKAIFGSGAKALLPSENIEFYLGFLNSEVALKYLQALSPTLNYESGHIASLPIAEQKNGTIDNLVTANITLSRADWDSFETSWDFQTHPLITARGNYEESQPLMYADDIVEGAVVTEWGKTSAPIAQAFDAWERETDRRFNTLKANEEDLNRIFIDIYGLQDELTPEVEDKDVTVRKADLAREIRSFISYAVGCMFGRYSLDVPGLAYAGGGWDGSKYSSYIPEDDNILPITDADYFEDDIVMCFVDFVKVVYGEDTLSENLEFIARALYPNGNGTAREMIRRYFQNDFFKDHCKIYQKRPIYWLFDSGKQNGFKALIYLHRYDKYTVARVRTEYLHPLQHKYEAEIERMNKLSDLPETSARDKAEFKKQTEKIANQIAECRAYDQIISHIAAQTIELNLDDGVKVNYEKFQGVEVPRDDGKGAVRMDLLGKI